MLKCITQNELSLSMSIISSHQPHYLPNLGYFYKMNSVDIFVVETNLEFEKREGWQRRHKIKGANKNLWLGIPILGSDTQLIKDVKINNQIQWRNKHKKSIQQTYAKTEYKDILEGVLAFYDKKWERLVDINFEMIKYFANVMGIKAKLILDEEVSGKKHTLIYAVANKYNVDMYLSGKGAKDYLTDDMIKDMKQHGVQHKFVKKSITADYPYCALHYLLTKGPKWVSSIIKD